MQPVGAAFRAFFKIGVGVLSAALMFAACGGENPAESSEPKWEATISLEITNEETGETIYVPHVLPGTASEKEIETVTGQLLDELGWSQFTVIRLRTRRLYRRTMDDGGDSGGGGGGGATGADVIIDVDLR